MLLFLLKRLNGVRKRSILQPAGRMNITAAWAAAPECNTD
jgi:hypothetical protein